MLVTCRLPLCVTPAAGTGARGMQRAKVTRKEEVGWEPCALLSPMEHDQGRDTSTADSSPANILAASVLTECSVITQQRIPRLQAWLDRDHTFL